MKNMFFLFFLISILSCSDKPFFQNFDTIENYELNENFYSHFKNQLIQKGDVDFIKLVESDNYPKSIKDTIKIFNVLNTNKFLKSKFSEKHTQFFKSLFNEKTFTNVYTNACEPVYRNILVLKNKNKTIGIIKICLDCEMTYIIGNNNFNNVGGIRGTDLKKFLKKHNR